jgi:tetratricopeptide (TPR) repeat protein
MKQIALILITSFIFPFSSMLAMGGNSFVEQEILVLQDKAVQAIALENYPLAKTHLTRIVELSSPEFRQTRTFIDYIFLLVETEINLGNPEGAKELLHYVPFNELPQDLQPSIIALKAKILTEQKKPNDAYKLLFEYSLQVRKESWPQDAKSLFLSLEFLLNEYYEDLIKKAEQLVDSGLFIESTPLYKEALNAIIANNFPAVSNSPLKNTMVSRLKYHLAKAYYEAGSYEPAIEILNTQIPKQSKVYENSLYLLTKIYSKLSYTQKTIQTAEQYFKLGNRQLLKRFDEVQWELGHAYFLNGEYEHAKKHFLVIPSSSKDQQFFLLARFHLAQIYLHQKAYSAMDDILNSIGPKISKNTPLAFEYNYLKGEVYFQKEQYNLAASFFEKALPQKNIEQANWYPSTLYNLAWSYLKLGTTPSYTPDEQIHYFNQSKDTFKKLILFNNSERGILGLARLHLLRFYQFSDEKDRLEAQNLLADPTHFAQHENQAESLLLRAELNENYFQRKTLYKDLTSTIFSKTNAYAEGWYYQGVNDFQEARRLHEETNTTKAQSLYTEAISSLEKAFNQLREKDPLHAALALQYKAQAYYYLSTQEAYQTAYSILDRLVTKDKTLFAYIPNKDEVLFFRGLLASRLSNSPEGKEYISIAKDSLKEILEKYSKGKFVDSALNLLGTLLFNQREYEEAEEVFLKLATEFPLSSYASEAWYWASECADWQHKSPETIKFFRLQVFEKYPDSKYAPESYFNYYSFSEYLQGQTAALEHLKKMPIKYPGSAPLVVAHYLLGLEHREQLNNQTDSIQHNLKIALEEFEKSVQTFDTCFKNNIFTSSNIEYYTNIRYRSLLEEGLLYLSQAHSESGVKSHIYLENAQKIFFSIQRDFEEKNHTLTHILTKGSHYPRLLEESQFGLAQVYIEINKQDLAEKVLSSMVENYTSAKIERGYYLSRCWYELGKIAMNKREFEIALKLFSHAEQAAKGRVLNTEQKLDLWIQQSLCYRILGDLNNAMLLLSQIINEDAASNLRIKAMYLRAEIYELEGRHDLAIKQLEATSIKGGDWALKAKTKLEETYGFN